MLETKATVICMLVADQIEISFPCVFVTSSWHWHWQWHWIPGCKGPPLLICCRPLLCTVCCPCTAASYFVFRSIHVCWKKECHCRGTWNTSNAHQRPPYRASVSSVDSSDHENHEEDSEMMTWRTSGDCIFVRSRVVRRVQPHLEGARGA